MEEGEEGFMEEDWGGFWKGSKGYDTHWQEDEGPNSVPDGP